MDNSLFDIFCLFFTAELIGAETIFLYQLKRRKHFLPKVIIFILVSLLVGLFFPKVSTDNVWIRSLMNFLRYFSIFTLTTVFAGFLFDESLTTIISSCTAGYALEHFTNRFLVLAFLSLPNDALQPTWILPLIKLVLYAPMYYFFGYWLFARRVSNPNNSDKRLNTLSVLIVILCMVVTRVGDFTERSTAFTVSDHLYGMTCAFLALVIKYTIHERNLKDSENEALKALQSKQAYEYRNWKNSIDVINLKCHDLKHQIDKNRLHPDTIKEIEDSIIIYDSAIKTGNEVLDLVLFEKNIACEKNHINFAYIVDGSIFQEYHEDDIFSLFGNILENAIEAVMQIPEEDNRVINLQVKKIADRILITEENTIAKPVTIVDGLPQTSKEDKEMHGFGMKSIRYFVEENHGSFLVSANDKSFDIKIVLPIKNAIHS